MTGGSGPTTLPDAVEAIYAAALDPDRWPDALDLIAQAVGGVGTVLVSLNPGHACIASPSLTEVIEAYRTTWWQHDPRNAAARSRRYTSGVYTDWSVFSQDEMRRDPFYQEFLRPHGLRAFVAQIVSPLPGQVAAISVQRDLRRADFEPDEVARFAVLGQHATRALTVATKLAEARRESRALEEAVEHLASGLIILDRGGRATFVNAGARALLGCGLDVCNARLVARTRAEQASLDALLASVLSPLKSRSPPCRTVAISRGEDRLPLLVQAMPVRSPPEVGGLDRIVLGPGAIVLLHDVATVSGRSVVERFVQLGLTPGQARVADAVGAGLSVGEAALRLGLTESTVRAVLKSVFERLGLVRQSQLAIIASRLRGIP